MSLCIHFTEKLVVKSRRKMKGALYSIRPDLAALYVSGYAGDALLEHGLAQDDAFLQKPYMPNVLIQRIRELLARRDGVERR